MIVMAAPGVPDPVKQGMTAVKLGQIVQLVKDNQLATAALLFIAWQIGFFAEAATYAGGVC